MHRHEHNVLHHTQLPIKMVIYPKTIEDKLQPAHSKQALHGQLDLLLDHQSLRRTARLTGDYAVAFGGQSAAIKLKRIGDILRRPEVRLTCGDYAPLIEEPGDSVWIYADPTYPLNNHSSPLYEHYMLNAEHEKMGALMKQCQHKVMISHGSSRYIRDLYSGWRVRKRRYSGSLPHRTPDRFKTALMITNY